MKGSLCGHYDICHLLLVHGALCERDTFQAERCLHNALNDRIRDLLMSYNYVMAPHVLQPFAAHVTSLLSRASPKTADIVLASRVSTFEMHKFVLATRSPYFARKLATAPETASWNSPASVSPEALKLALQYLYLSEVTAGLGEKAKRRETLAEIGKISKQLEIDLFESIMETTEWRTVRQHRARVLEKAQEQFSVWFRENVIKNKVVLDTEAVPQVKWDANNAIFADVLLRAEEDTTEADIETDSLALPASPTPDSSSGIPIGSLNGHSPHSRQRGSLVLYPAHRAMLIRSEYFLTMFTSEFREAQPSEYLQVIAVDCSPEVLEIVLAYLYTDRADFGLDLALDTLFAADWLFIDKLKQRAALTISALGSRAAVKAADASSEEALSPDGLDVYEVLRAAWTTRVPRLESFAARYIADRLERFIDEPAFAELVQESAERIKARQETDTVELIDDIRYFLSERFRMRFEDVWGEDADDTSEADFVSLASVSVANKEGVVRTLQGEAVSDEFAQEAINYRLLLGKIDHLLQRLHLDG